MDYSRVASAGRLVNDRMSPAPMPRAQTALIIIATFLVAGALLPWSGRLRLTCSAIAFVIVFAVFTLRLRAHTRNIETPADRETQARIERIRAERDRRMGPRRR